MSNLTASRAIYELARAMHADRGMENWDRLTEASRKRWYKRAEDTLRRCPTLRDLIWGA